MQETRVLRRFSKFEGWCGGACCTCSNKALISRAVFPLTIPVALLYVFLLQFGGGFGAQSFFQLWSAEMFPTMLRSTAQGLCFAIVRVALGVFSFFVPALNATGFTTLAWILTGFLIVSGVIGLVWAPRNEGKSLEQLERERGLLRGENVR